MTYRPLLPTMLLALLVAAHSHAQTPTDAGPAAAPPPATDAGVAAAPVPPPEPPKVEAPPPGSVNECAWGISKEMTERLGGIVEKDFPANSKCKYAGMLTQKTVLDVNWTLDGKAQAPLRVSTRQCMVSPPPGNGEFVVDVPEAMKSQCPEATAFLTNFQGALGKEQPLDGNVGNRQKHRRPYSVLAVVVAVAIGLILWRRSREKQSPPSGPAPK